MRISMIVAIARNGVIGKDNQMPWRLPTDLKHFKQTTSGHAVVMGRKTFESIGRALPNRLNIVITRNVDFQAEGCALVTTPEAAIAAAQAAGHEELMVMGGAQIYQLFEPLAQRMVITQVQADPDGDTFYSPDLTGWRETGRLAQAATENDSADMVFVELERS
ncbi:MAG: dihydrofolate reductase [Parvibaculales bacterium]